MEQIIDARFEYWMTAVLILVGFYGMLAKRNLVKTDSSASTSCRRRSSCCSSR